MKRIAAGLIAVALLLAGGPARGHDLNAAVLEVRELPGGQVLIALREAAPAGTAALAIELPAACAVDEPATASAEPARQVTRRVARCPSGLRGGAIGVRFAGREADVLARVTLADGGRVSGVLTPARPALAIPARAGGSRLAVARDYGRLGIGHILRGADHLLFVLGLVLLARTRRALVATLTAFTAGHSVTLALATLGVVRVPAAPTEAVIALSVLLLAVELVQREPGAAARWPWLVAGGFGLLHGLGFAGALAAVGLPAGEIPLALASFNVGVELGQLAVAAVVWLARPIVSTRLAAYAIGSVAVYWCIERATAFW